MLASDVEPEQSTEQKTMLKPKKKNPQSRASRAVLPSRRCCEWGDGQQLARGSG